VSHSFLQEIEHGAKQGDDPAKSHAHLSRTMQKAVVHLMLSQLQAAVLGLRLEMCILPHLAQTNHLLHRVVFLLK
jgi:hypothetical protein